MIMIAVCISTLSNAQGVRGISFENLTIEEAQSRCILEDKLLLIHIKVEGIEFDRKSIDSIQDPSNYVEDKFVCIELDVSDESIQRLMKLYDCIEVTPTCVLLSQKIEVIDFVEDNKSFEIFLRRVLRAVEPKESERRSLFDKYTEDTASIEELGRLLTIMHEDDEDGSLVSRSYRAMKKELDLVNNRSDLLAVVYAPNNLYDENVKLFLESMTGIVDTMPELANEKMYKIVLKIRDNAGSLGDREQLRKDLEIIYPALKILLKEDVMPFEEMYNAIESQI